MRQTFFLLLVWILSPAGYAQTVVTPQTSRSAEGNSNNLYPFTPGGGMRSQRMQQVYAASDFAGTGAKIWITEIAFRPDAYSGSAFAVELPQVQVNLSTTLVAPDGLSPVFAVNLGTDDTVVFNGPLALSSQFTGPADGPKDFDIRIKLPAPFPYEPDKGNLLLDIRNFEAAEVPVALDAVMQYGDATSRVFSYGLTDSVYDSRGIADNFFSLGLVTQFTYEGSTREMALAVAFDIKPASCPNSWNISAEGVLPAAILGSPALDVRQIDPNSVRLVGVAPLRYSLEDVAAPFEPYLGKEAAGDCVSLAADGNPDLGLKFDSQQVAEAVQAALGRELVDSEALVLRMTGLMRPEFGGEAIEGEEVVVVLKKKK